MKSGAVEEVKPPALREPEHGEPGPKCEADEPCGGRETWCSQCRRWSRTCCVPYGTCQCS
jgi:hypothetical protein